MTTFRQLVASERPLVLPGAHDAISARNSSSAQVSKPTSSADFHLSVRGSVFPTSA